MLVTMDWSRMTKGPCRYESEAYPPRSADVWLALGVVQAGLLDVYSKRSGSRAVPSAGAIYPYDVLIVTREEDALAVFKVDPIRRVCQHLDARCRASQLLSDAGLPELPSGGAHLVILTRPWLSMRKYGMRGYIYAQLDAAHLGANLLGGALGARHQAELRLRVLRREFREALPGLTPDREVACVLTISPRCAPEPVDGWTVWRHSGSDSDQDCELLGEMQRLCWNRIPAWVRDSAGEPSEPVSQSVVSYSTTKTAPDLLGQWHELSKRRSSSAGFVPEPIQSSKLERVFAASTLPLPVDTAPDCKVVLSAYLPPSHSASETNCIIRACNGQEHLRHARAFGILHADGELLAADRPYLVREALFKAGAGGHLLYLAATAEEVGVTAVGGFHGTQWREIIGLPTRQEVLYVVAMGHRAVDGIKHDRASVAHAHGA